MRHSEIDSAQKTHALYCNQVTPYHSKCCLCVCVRREGHCLCAWGVTLHKALLVFILAVNKPCAMEHHASFSAQRRYWRGSPQTVSSLVLFFFFFFQSLAA